MGLLDKWRAFKQNRLEKNIERSAKLVTNPKAMREDRAAAIEFLHDLDDHSKAVPALLARFEYSLDHGINDTREKEAAMAGITHRGEAAIPYVLDKLRNTTRIAWPIKILTAVGTEEQLIDGLKSCLNFDDVAFDQAQVDRNFDVLCYLRDYRLPNFSEKLTHFLTDNDERVRYASAEVLIEQAELKDYDIANALEPFLADVSPENSRIRQIVCEAFAKHAWKISQPEKLNGLPLAQGVRWDAQAQMLTPSEQPQANP